MSEIWRFFGGSGDHANARQLSHVQCRPVRVHLRRELDAVCVCRTFRSYMPIICHVKCHSVANNQRQSTGSWAPIHGFCCTGEFVALCWRLREWKISWSLHTFAQCLCSWLWKGKDKGIFRLKYVFCYLKFHIVWITCESHVTFILLGPHWTHIAFGAKIWQIAETLLNHGADPQVTHQETDALGFLLRVGSRKRGRSKSFTNFEDLWLWHLLLETEFLTSVWGSALKFFEACVDFGSCERTFAVKCETWDDQRCLAAVSYTAQQTKSWDCDGLSGCAHLSLGPWLF